MAELLKNTKDYWFIVIFLGAIIVTWNTNNEKIKTIEINDAKQDIKIEKQDVILRKIEVDVTYVRAILENKYE